MILPAWTPLNITLTIIYALLALSMGIGEYTSVVRMRYSKFRMQKGIPGRSGMFVLYFVPFVGALSASVPDLSTLSLVQTLVLASLLVHFGKRSLEALFLHKYSGPIDLSTTLMIMSFYTTVSVVIAVFNRWPLVAPNGPFWLGLALFVVGVAGNFWHHKLLADLRRDTRDYIIPRGGLFNYVVCPHYLFEIVTWLGIAMLSQHLFAYITVLGMGSYLAARSINTLKWYHEKFLDFPKKRKAIIPYVL